MKDCKIPLMAPPPKRKELSDNPVKLCHEISRICRTKMRSRCDIEGVMSQHGARLVLALLIVEDGLSQRELAERTHLRPPTVSLIIKKMVDEGIAELRADEKDMRINRVFATELGRRIDAEQIDRIKATDAEGLKGLTDEEQATLMELLYKIRNNLLCESEEQKRK